MAKGTLSHGVSVNRAEIRAEIERE